MKTRIILACIALALASCVNVVRVKEEKLKADNTTADRSVEGIPFYVKTEMFKQVTVYRQTWLRATLTVSQKLVDIKENKEVTSDAGAQTFTRDIPKKRIISAGEVDKLTKLKQDILKANTEPGVDTAKLIADFGQLDAIDPNRLPEPELVGNAIDSTWVVDRSRTYYLNAPLPWFGAGSLTQELSSDGTLTKAISAPDTKVGEGLSTLIPFKEYLTGEFVKTAAEAATEGSSIEVQVKSLQSSLRDFAPQTLSANQRLVTLVSLALNEVGYEYKLTSLPQATPMVTTAPLKFEAVTNKTALFVRTDIGPEATKEEKKDDGQKVGISGSINFPKGWPGGEAKPKE